MQEKLMKLMMKSEDLASVKETLLSWVKEEVGQGKDCFHVESAGQVVDMIKDLAETEKECAEALYYTTVVQAMAEEGDPSYENMGYNHRHMGNGQFASAGRGHVVRGYHHRPYVDQEPYIDGYLHDPNFASHMRSMGYDDGSMNHHGNMGNSGRSSKYGESYDHYQESRRHYTVSKNPADKEEMKRHAMDHVDNMLESLQEMWESSDDAMLKKRIMDEMTEVINEMKKTMK